MRSSPLAADFSTGAALFLFFLIVLLLNPLARAVDRLQLAPGRVGDGLYHDDRRLRDPLLGFRNEFDSVDGGFHFTPPRRTTGRN